MTKTLAEIAAQRFTEKSLELLLSNNPLPKNWPQWIRDNVPSPAGTWGTANEYGYRGPLLAVVIYDDGSHLDILPGGAVFPW